jgi:hypothetical protein
MGNGSRLKDEMIEKLWLPKAKEAGSAIYPRRKKHARMRMLTLSDGLDLGEVFKLEEANLVTREDSVAWVSSMNKRWRVESENIGLVIDGHVYDPSFLRSSCPLVSRFPFDILNLDFGSQDTDTNEGRTESEIMSFEKFIDLQKRTGKSSFLVIFTVLINSCGLDCARVVAESNGMRVNGWGGIKSGEYPQRIEEQSEKTDFIQAIANSVIRKYGYSCSNGLVPLLSSDSNRILFSVAGVLVR